MHWISNTVFFLISKNFFKNDKTEIQWIFGLNFFQAEYLKFLLHMKLRFSFYSA